MSQFAIYKGPIQKHSRMQNAAPNFPTEIGGKLAALAAAYVHVLNALWFIMGI